MHLALKVVIPHSSKRYALVWTCATSWVDHKDGKCPRVDQERYGGFI